MDHNRTQPWTHTLQNAEESFTKWMSSATAQAVFTCTCTDCSFASKSTESSHKQKRSQIEAVQECWLIVVLSTKAKSSLALKSDGLFIIAGHGGKATYILYAIFTIYIYIVYVYYTLKILTSVKGNFIINLRCIDF